MCTTIFSTFQHEYFLLGIVSPAERVRFWQSTIRSYIYKIPSWSVWSCCHGIYPGIYWTGWDSAHLSEPKCRPSHDFSCVKFPDRRSRQETQCTCNAAPTWFRPTLKTYMNACMFLQTWIKADLLNAFCCTLSVCQKFVKILLFRRCFLFNLLMRRDTVQERDWVTETAMLCQSPKLNYNRQEPTSSADASKSPRFFTRVVDSVMCCSRKTVVLRLQLRDAETSLPSTSAASHARCMHWTQQESAEPLWFLSSEKDHDFCVKFPIFVWSV